VVLAWKGYFCGAGCFRFLLSEGADELGAKVGILSEQPEQGFEAFDLADVICWLCGFSAAAGRWRVLGFEEFWKCEYFDHLIVLSSCVERAGTQNAGWRSVRFSVFDDEVTGIRNKRAKITRNIAILAARVAAE
jgi:hypothetical protein